MATVAPSRPTRKAPSTAAGRLTAGEREIVLVIADDEETWAVYTDSRRALSTALLRAARRWGREPVRVSHGWEVRVPLGAVRFAGPPSARALAQRRRAAEAAQQARMASKPHRARRLLDGSEPVGVS
jgi:hypothetical protein